MHTDFKNSVGDFSVGCTHKDRTHIYVNVWHARIIVFVYCTNISKNTETHTHTQNTQNTHTHTLTHKYAHTYTGLVKI